MVNRRQISLKYEDYQELVKILEYLQKKNQYSTVHFTNVMRYFFDLHYKSLEESNKQK